MKARLAWPLGVFTAAFALRLFGLSRQPFWLDEVFTMQRASLQPAALTHDSFLHHHMPTFFLILSPLTMLGDPQFWLRLWPAAFGAVSVMLVYLIAQRIAGRTAGLAAALVLGMSPSAVAFSQEARSYTMEMSLILIALYGLVILALQPQTAGLKWRDQAMPRTAWLAFALGSAAALDVLGDALPWVLTANLIGLYLLRQAPDRRGFLRNFLLADAVIIALSAPLYLIMTMTIQEKFTDSVMWIPQLSFAKIWYDVGSIYLLRIADAVSFNFVDVLTPPAVIWLIDAVLLLAVGFGAWRLRRSQAALVTLGLSFAVLPVMLIVISIWHPVLLPRYMLWSAAPFTILAGIGASAMLNALPRRRRAWAMGLAAVLLAVNLAPYYHAETKPRWDVAAQMLAAEVSQGDVVYLDDKGALPELRMYLPSNTTPIVLNDAVGDLDHARQAQLQGKRVWVVYGHAGQSVTNAGWEDFYPKLSQLGTPAAIQMAGKRIHIALYTPASHSLAANCVLQANGICG